MRRIIYDGDSFYELDEECVRRHRRGETAGQTQERAGRPSGKVPNEHSQHREEKAGRSRRANQD